MASVALWSFAVFMASVFAGLLTGITLTPKYKASIRAVCWGIGAVCGYILAFISYSINMYNDAIGILGLSALVCMVSQFLYKDSWSTKLSIALMACLIANVSTFMFCGTTDTLLGKALGLIQDSPYDIPNLILFIIIKMVVYTILSILYACYLKKTFHRTIEAVGGKMTVFLPALFISVIGFYLINLVSNSVGIYPDSPWFFLLYITVCIIFIIEFWMIFYSILQSAKTMKTTAELNVATNIQKSMLPCIFPAFPDREEFDIFASMEPAREVGGDFYDFFMVDEQHLAIVAADVSGKGVPAALFMVIGKTLIKDHTQPGRDLGEVFTEVNELLCESNSEGMFITAFEGVLDLATGEFCYVNAGHEIPFLCKKDSEFEPHKIRAGFVLAGMEGIRYKSGVMQLEPGDKFFQYTDGVTEAMNKNNDLYGMERLGRVLKKHAALAPSELLPAVKEDIDAFVGGAEQFDDITMICFEYKKQMITGDA